MGRKQRQQDSLATTIPNRDTLSRMSFLAQAGTFMASLGALEGVSTASSHADGPTKTKKMARSGQPVLLANLSRFYMNNMQIVGDKIVGRIDTTLKHSMCRFCKLPLVPGRTALSHGTLLPRLHVASGSTVATQDMKCTSRSRTRSVKHIYSTCLSCSTTNRIYVPPSELTKRKQYFKTSGEQVWNQTVNDAVKEVTGNAETINDWKEVELKKDQSQKVGEKVMKNLGMNEE